MCCYFRCIVFGNKSSSKYLVGATEHYLTVWDLLTCSGKLCVCVCVRVCMSVYVSINSSYISLLVCGVFCSAVDLRSMVSILCCILSTLKKY